MYTELEPEFEQFLNTIGEDEFYAVYDLIKANMEPVYEPDTRGESQTQGQERP